MQLREIPGFLLLPKGFTLARAILNHWKVSHAKKGQIVGTMTQL